jgi:nucleotide-binding universal stress UspA family protein
MKNILVSVDFSDVTPALVEIAKKYASAFGCHIILLNVLPEPRVAPMGVGDSYVFVRDTITDYNLLNELNKQLLDAGFKVSTEQPEGPPVTTILKKTEELKADLIIMGTHGHGAVYNLLVGSVTEGVLKSAKWPVLVVPSPRK